jgi:hypothetical protein
MENDASCCCHPWLVQPDQTGSTTQVAAISRARSRLLHCMQAVTRDLAAGRHTSQPMRSLCCALVYMEALFRSQLAYPQLLLLFRSIDWRLPLSS